MSRLVLTKGQDGKLQGLDPKGQRAWDRFKSRLKALDIGDTLGFTFFLPRDPVSHRRFFRKLQVLLERTETFAELDHLRAWLLMGAGYCDYIPGVGGELRAVPQSMAFDAMDQAEFMELNRKVDEFLYTDRALEVLWPGLGSQQQWNCLTSFLEDLRR
ncbi:DUF1367 family protein [Comamonas sp. NoAH]|uniref:DUF1367 family protein n=1 Tax=Comamonas halotolerans TaxID=3041496 RepID=UPI0024E1192D|nr:DUF1367 family protein [Comamonas sp. NoAH]